VHLIDTHHQDLLKEDHNDPSFAATSKLWKFMLGDEQQAHFDAYEGPMCPSQFNKNSFHAWWYGHNYEEVMARWSYHQQRQ
jgi:hypothetical protein